MTKYQVITASGADYIIDTDQRMWYHRGTLMGTYWKFQQSYRDTPKSLPWQDPTEWEPVDRPNLGRRMYLATNDNWRISTPVVFISEVPE
jgi:hypothetical protein